MVQQGKKWFMQYSKDSKKQHKDIVSLRNRQDKASSIEEITSRIRIGD